jgi:hypothetical protein
LDRMAPFLRAAVELSQRRSGLDEALKAGIGATLCSILFLAVMHRLPIGLG